MVSLSTAFRNPLAKVTSHPPHATKSALALVSKFRRPHIGNPSIQLADSSSHSARFGYKKAEISVPSQIFR